MGTICPVHGQAFKLVPAGVSKKTGKPYQAFWSCPTIGCREKPEDGVNHGSEVMPNAGPSPAMTVPPYKRSPLLEKEEETAEQKMWRKKGEQMNRSNLAQAVLQGKEIDFDVLEQMEAWVLTGEKPTAGLDEIAKNIPF